MKRQRGTPIPTLAQMPVGETTKHYKSQIVQGMAGNYQGKLWVQHHWGSSSIANTDEFNPVVEIRRTEQGFELTQPAALNDFRRMSTARPNAANWLPVEFKAPS